MSATKRLLQFKKQALLLYKEIKTTGKDSSAWVDQKSTQRLFVLPRYKDQASRALSALASVSLKDCLEVIAMEQGARCWDDLCLSLDINARLYIKGICDSGMNVWFREYREAKAYLAQNPGCYLLPYEDYFFICHKGHIEKIGLDPNDVNWQKIGFDWECPLDQDAKKKLMVQLNRH